MKLISLVYTKLISVTKQNLMIVFFICVALVSCDLMFLYVVGINNIFRMDSSAPDYYIEHKSGEMFLATEMKNCISTISEESEIIYYAAIDGSLSSYAGREISGELYSIRATDNIDNFRVVRGKMLDKRNQGSVLIPYTLSEAQIGEIITINGVKFEIAGCIAVDDYFLISTETMIAAGFPVAAATIHIGDLGKVEEKLQSILNKNYSVYYKEYELPWESTRNNLFIILVLYILCVLSFLFFGTYLYEDSSYEFNVYQILGARKAHVVFIMLGTIDVIVTGVYWITAFFHHMYFDDIFKNLLSEPYRYTFSDYVSVYLCSTAIISLFLAVYLLAKTRKSMIVNSRKMIR